MDEDSDLILNVNTNVHVESLRSVETCRKLVDSLALISMQLLEHEQRIIFKNCDGLTTLGNDGRVHYVVSFDSQLPASNVGRARDTKV